MTPEGAPAVFVIHGLSLCAITRGGDAAMDLTIEPIF